MDELWQAQQEQADDMYEIGAPGEIRTPDHLVRSPLNGMPATRWALTAIAAAQHCKSLPDYAPTGPLLRRFRGRFATGVQA